MPVIASSYQPPAPFRLGHLQTVLPTLARRVPLLDYQRQSVDTPDGDFLNLDWVAAGHRRLAVICHGLEGDSQRAYVRGMAHALLAASWGRASLQLPRLRRTAQPQASLLPQRRHRRPARGGGGRPWNGATSPLALVGFSLDEHGQAARPHIRGGVGLSVPCDLADNSRRMELPQNRVYVARFLSMLQSKIRTKMKLMPGAPDDRDYGRIKNFRQFDDCSTAPLHGFADAMDYIPPGQLPLLAGAHHRACSHGQRPGRPPAGAGLLHLGRGPCQSPVPSVDAAQNVYVGFMAGGGRYCSEARAVEFLAQTTG